MFIPTWPVLFGAKQSVSGSRRQLGVSAVNYE